MSQLAERLADDMKAALRDKDKFTLSVIRMLRSEIQYAEKESNSALKDSQVLDILGRELKKRKEALAENQRFGREQAAVALAQELEIIACYLPVPLTKEELRTLVAETIQETQAATKADFGKVMATLMPKTKGRAEGSEVSALVKEFLN
ncbi:MAG: GatB/YqeY domain-containing protein [Peptococcaceae bacterium]|jgi:uncharacterized protein YqeY|nr:GatB/YqeY domain-containing protein [Peptococcaceae bacterium]